MNLSLHQVAKRACDAFREGDKGKAKLEMYIELLEEMMKNPPPQSNVMHVLPNQPVSNKGPGNFDSRGPTPANTQAARNKKHLDSMGFSFDKDDDE